MFMETNRENKDNAEPEPGAILSFFSLFFFPVQGNGCSLMQSSTLETRTN